MNIKNLENREVMNVIINYKKTKSMRFYEIDLNYLTNAENNREYLDFKFESLLSTLLWSCPSEFLESGSVILTVHYLERNRDGAIMTQLLIENKEEVMTKYNDVNNEIKNLTLFTIQYFQNEYVLLLTDEHRKSWRLSLPDNISFSCRID